MSGEESTPPQQYDAILYFDGASRGNPGPARFGAVLCDATTGNRLAVTAGALENGDGTNNEAEYTALIRGLELAREHGVRRLLVRGDSLLVVRQVNGEWRIKKDTLRALAQRARDLAVSFEQIRITWIPREENAEADALANEQFETGKMKKYYVVWKGHSRGVFDADWSTVQQYTIGYSGVQYKGFDNLQKALSFWDEKVVKGEVDGPVHSQSLTCNGTGGAAGADVEMTPPPPPPPPISSTPQSTTRLPATPPPPPLAPVRKFAFLIGVAEYHDNRNNVPSCAYDVVGMEQALVPRRWSVTRAPANPQFAGALEALVAFVYGLMTKDAGAVDQVFFGYSGHGLEIGTENYLTTASPYHSEHDIKKMSIRLQHHVITLFQMVKAKHPGARFFLVVNACRNAPQPPLAPGASGPVPQPSVLQNTENARDRVGTSAPSPDHGFAISFATSPNAPAFGGLNHMSPHIRALVTVIDSPEADVRSVVELSEELHRCARNHSNDMQQPFFVHSMDSDSRFMF